MRCGGKGSEGDDDNNKRGDVYGVFTLAAPISSKVKAYKNGLIAFCIVKGREESPKWRWWPVTDWNDMPNACWFANWNIGLEEWSAPPWFWFDLQLLYNASTSA